MPEFQYTVDDEPQTTEHHVLTANQILSNAAIDPAQHYLVELKGATRESYETRGDEEIHMHQHMRFVSVRVGPTPVSDSQ
jgi:hypothetical protein